MEVQGQGVGRIGFSEASLYGLEVAVFSSGPHMVFSLHPYMSVFNFLCL